MTTCTTPKMEWQISNEILGHGTFSDVKRATSTSGIEAICKLTKLHGSQRRNTILYVMKEVATLLQANHESIVQVRPRHVTC
jgi:hypothetical protein